MTACLYDTYASSSPELSIISNYLSMKLSPKGQARPCLGGSCQTFEVAHQYHTISCPWAMPNCATSNFTCHVYGSWSWSWMKWADINTLPFPSIGALFKGMHKKYIHIYIYIYIYILKFILHIVAAPLSREYVIIYSIHKICNYCYIWPLKFTLKWNF